MSATYISHCLSLTHLLQNTRVNHLGHLTVELGHLRRVHILCHVSTCRVTVNKKLTAGLKHT